MCGEEGENQEFPCAKSKVWHVDPEFGDPWSCNLKPVCDGCLRRRIILTLGVENADLIFEKYFYLKHILMSHM